MADTGAHNVTHEQSTDRIDLSDRKNEAEDCEVSLSPAGENEGDAGGQDGAGEDGGADDVALNQKDGGGEAVEEDDDKEETARPTTPQRDDDDDDDDLVETRRLSPIPVVVWSAGGGTGGDGAAPVPSPKKRARAQSSVDFSAGVTGTITVTGGSVVSGGASAVGACSAVLSSGPTPAGGSSSPADTNASAGHQWLGASPAPVASGGPFAAIAPIEDEPVDVRDLLEAGIIIDEDGVTNAAGAQNNVGSDTYSEEELPNIDDAADDEEFELINSSPARRPDDDDDARDAINDIRRAHKRRRMK